MDEYIEVLWFIMVGGYVYSFLDINNEEWYLVLFGRIKIDFWWYYYCFVEFKKDFVLWKFWLSVNV